MDLVTAIRLGIVACALVVGQAHAEFIVKRFPCKDLVNTGSGYNVFYVNESGDTTRVNFQVLKNRCFPKDLSIWVGTSTSASAPTTSNIGLVSGKFPPGFGITLFDNFAGTFFVSPAPDKVRGTIDYSYSVD